MKMVVEIVCIGIGRSFIYADLIAVKIPTNR